MNRFTVENADVQALLDKENNARREMFAASAEIWKIRKTCVHVYVPNRPPNPSDKFDSPSCHCKSCGEDGGWWCPKSPDGKCDYQQKDGGYNPDHCVWCHNPDERK